MPQPRVVELAIQTRSGEMKTRIELSITCLDGPYGDPRGYRGLNGGRSQVLAVSLDQLDEIWGKESPQTWLDGPIEKGNILISGVIFNEAYTLNILRELHIGDALIEVTGLLRNADNRIYGVTCRVRQGGIVRIGDPVI